jgi:GNAT superfamily N-acetyltransferase
MAIHATTLKVEATGQELSAELHDDLPIDALFEAEEFWAPERVRILRDCLLAKIATGLLPQSIHWCWSMKAFKMQGLTFGALSPYRLFGIKADNYWQGLLLGSCIGYQSRIEPKGRDLVYVKYVESAPWNWKLQKIGRTARFKGIGYQLMEMAVQWSIDLGFKGRLGLHALPQADSFYQDVCRMTDLGIDKAHQPLRYFEFSEQQAKKYLMEA